MNFLAACEFQNDSENQNVIKAPPHQPPRARQALRPIPARDVTPAAVHHHRTPTATRMHAHEARGPDTSERSNNDFQFSNFAHSSPTPKIHAIPSLAHVSSTTRRRSAENAFVRGRILFEAGADLQLKNTAASERILGHKPHTHRVALPLALQFTLNLTITPAESLEGGDSFHGDGLTVQKIKVYLPCSLSIDSVFATRAGSDWAPYDIETSEDVPWSCTQPTPVKRGMLASRGACEMELAVVDQSPLDANRAVDAIELSFVFAAADPPVCRSLASL